MNGNTIFQADLDFPPRGMVKVGKRDPTKRTKVECGLNTLFSDRLHFATRNWLFGQAITWWMDQLSGAPKMRTVAIHLTYQTNSTNWDLDNFDGFWRKALLDALKTSHPPRLVRKGRNAGKMKTDRPRLGIVRDDKVTDIRGLSSWWQPGPDLLRIRFAEVPEVVATLAFPESEDDGHPF